MMKRGVTPIEDLLDLDDQERSERERELDKVRIKSIRNTGKYGGMRDYEPQYNNVKPIVQHTAQLIAQPTTQLIQAPQQPVSLPPFQPQIMEEPSFQENYKYRIPIDCMQISCLDICNHTIACPVCTKIYANTDRSIFIAIIVVLVIICILLLKRVMEMK